MFDNSSKKKLRYSPQWTPLEISLFIHFLLQITLFFLSLSLSLSELFFLQLLLTPSLCGMKQDQSQMLGTFTWLEPTPHSASPAPKAPAMNLMQRDGSDVVGTWIWAWMFQRVLACRSRSHALSCRAAPPPQRSRCLATQQTEQSQEVMNFKNFKLRTSLALVLQIISFSVSQSD